MMRHTSILNLVKRHIKIVFILLKNRTMRILKKRNSVSNKSHQSRDTLSTWKVSVNLGELMTFAATDCYRYSYWTSVLEYLSIFLDLISNWRKMQGFGTKMDCSLIIRSDASSHEINGMDYGVRFHISIPEQVHIVFIETDLWLVSTFAWTVVKIEILKII